MLHSKALRKNAPCTLDRQVAHLSPTFSAKPLVGHPLLFQSFTCPNISPSTMRFVVTILCLRDWNLVESKADSVQRTHSYTSVLLKHSVSGGSLRAILAILIEALRGDFKRVDFRRTAMVGSLLKKQNCILTIIK